MLTHGYDSIINTDMRYTSFERLMTTRVAVPKWPAFRQLAALSGLAAVCFVAR